VLRRPLSSALFGLQSVCFITLASPLKLLASSLLSDILNTDLTEYAFGVSDVLVDVTIDVLFRLSIHVRTSRSTF
jgi:hypothetical protein